LRDWLAWLVGDALGEPVGTEQVVPKWNYRKKPTVEHPEGKLVEAQLDVSFPWYGVRTHVDVAITTAATSARGDVLSARAREDGHAARAKVIDKLRTYPPDKNPGETLVPFVFEALGRPSEEAVAFLRALAPTDPRHRAVWLSRAWTQASNIIQTRLAELYLSAELPRPPR